MRGFALDQLGAPGTIDKDGIATGGNALMIVNGELRVPVYRGLGVVGFVDTGNVFARTDDISLGEFRTAVGFSWVQIADRTDPHRSRLQAGSAHDCRTPRGSDRHSHQSRAGFLTMRFLISDCRFQIAVRIAMCLAMLTAASSRVRADEVIDRVLAVVGGEMISLTDVTAARDLGLVPAPAAGDPIRAILSQLIDRELILAEVDRYTPPEPGAAAIDRQVRAVRERLGSEQAFARALARSGIDEKHLRETLREDLQIDAFIESALRRPGAQRRRAEWVLHRTSGGVHARGRARAVRRRAAAGYAGRGRRAPQGAGGRLDRRAAPPRGHHRSIPDGAVIDPPREGVLIDPRLQLAAAPRNAAICSRSNPAWLTIGATADRRRR